MKISYVKLIFIFEGSISDVKNMFSTPTFQMWNFELVHFIRELGISYVNMFQFGIVMKISYWKCFNSIRFLHAE